MTGVLLAYVRRIGGDAAVDQVLALSGTTTPLSELEDPAHWSSYEETRRRFAAAAEVLDDPEVGRRAGIELFRHYASTEIITILRSLGSPAEALRVIAQTATKQSTVVTMECVEATDTHALVSAVTMAPIRRDQLFCDYTAGVLTSMPTVFGFDDGEVTELECQRFGDTRCLYRVRWDPATARDPDTRAAFLAAQLAAMTERFEALERLGSELASMNDVDEALQTIAERAGVAVWAPRFLLAVRLPREQVPRVHSVGFNRDEAISGSAELLADPPDDHGGSWLIADVASSAHAFGRLAAVAPDGHRFLAEEQRLLQAYAGHAAAVLATAAALGEARARAATIGALFDLATALAQVTSVDDVAERLAHVLPPVVDCDEASVYVWEARDAVLVCRGRGDLSSASAVGFERVEGETATSSSGTAIALDQALFGQLTRHPEPIPFGPHVGASPWTNIGAAAGYRAGLLMPIVARQTLLGLVVAGSDRWSPPIAPSESLRERLHGVAGIAATAFDNALLLDQIRHQAGHDALTGLPNGRLLEELTAAALSMAKRHGYGVGMLFVDLDLFKEVNDELGHHAGDQLLIEVGSRLRSAVRAGDSVARLGGDEFGVLLPHVTDVGDAETVAERVIESLHGMVTEGGLPVRVSASVGIAMSPTGTETFDSMLRRADAAMYEAKNRGRARYRVGR